MFLKKHFYILKVRNRFSASVQVAQRQLFLYYADKVSTGLVPKLHDTGFRVFSQFEEDGLLFFINAVIGSANNRFIEIGSNDGINSNCANFALNFGWHGLFIDADKSAIERGKYFYKKYPVPGAYPPQFIAAKVTRENINALIGSAGFEGEIDVLSIDIDGNDYWIWDALTIIHPRIVIIETHVEFGYNNVVVPYDPTYTYPGKHPVYHGASPIAMQKLAHRKGYRLVGANNLGFNTIYVRNGLGDQLIPEVSVESILQHPATIESFTLFDEISDWEYIEGK